MAFIPANIGGNGGATESLTPSNSTPAQITSGNDYHATASGYAIESYDSVTPSSTQTAVSSGDIVKIGGSGVIVNSVPTPASLAPSNRSPVALAGKGLYRVEGDFGVTEGYAIASYDNLSSGLSNREYEYLYSGNSFYRTQYGAGSGYFYNNKPTGRVLFSWSSQPTANTSWTDYDFTGTAYDADASTFTALLDDNFAHIDGNGDIVVDRAIPTAYIAGIAWYGRTSSGTTVYSGIRMLKNGTVITGASAYGSSSDNSPGFRRIETSFAVGDVISVQRRTSSTTSSTVKTSINITTP